MDIPKLIEDLKAMGLCSRDRQICVAIYGDAGLEEALEAARYMAARDASGLKASLAANADFFKLNKGE